MSKIEQIEEMAKAIYEQNNSYDTYWQSHCESLAEELYNAGYRKSAEVAEEIFAEIEDVLNNIGYFDELDFEALKKKYTEEGK